MKTYFSGEYDRVLIEVGGAPIVVDEDLVIPPKNVTELDRLAYVVHSIDSQCQVVPKGALKFTPLKEVRFNEAFMGLPKQHAFDLTQWKHFRVIQQKDKVDIMMRDEAVYNNDFLDEITEDLPKRQWCLTKDCTETTAILKSLLWPGYCAYHRTFTPIYGALYIGYGIRNHDLPFML